MKPKTMILMVVAVVCGLGASYMTSRLLAEREQQEPQVVVKEVPKVNLLVAKKFLAVNTLIKAPRDLFVEKAFVQEDAPKEAIRDWKDLQGKTVKLALRAGDAITPENVQDGTPTLAVPPGMRAVGLRVTVDAIAAGFASLPGSSVDIYFNMRGDTVDKSFSMRLLQKVLVLAADMAETSEGARAIPASVVTLALTPEDTQRVSLASEHGTLRLVLRDKLDDAIGKDEKVTLKQVIAGKTRNERPDLVDDVPVVQPEPGKEPKVAGKVDPKVDPKVDAEPVPEIKPRRQHVVWFRQGEKQWKEVFELDENGNVITDDVQRFEAPPAPPANPPAVQPAPQPPAAPNAPAENDKKK